MQKIQTNLKILSFLSRIDNTLFVPVQINDSKWTKRACPEFFRLFFNCLRPIQLSKDCKSRTCSVTNWGKWHNKLLHSDFSKKVAVATNTTKWGLLVVRIKMTNRDLFLNVLAMFNLGFSIYLVDKSQVTKLQFRGRKAFLSVAGILGSQDV